MPLPNPAMSFSPFAILTAEELNNFVENIAALQNGSGFNSNSVDADFLLNNTVEERMIDWSTFNISFAGYQNISQGSANGAKVNIDTETYDTANAFNPATGTFTAPIKGLYHFDGNIQTNAGNAVLAGIQRTSTTYGSLVKRGSWVQYGASFIASNVSTDLLLDVGDTVWLQCVQMGGTATIANGPGITYFEGHIVFRDV